MPCTSVESLAITYPANPTQRTGGRAGGSHKDEADLPWREPAREPPVVQVEVQLAIANAKLEVFEHLGRILRRACPG
jgi:hypothetical protein